MTDFKGAIKSSAKSSHWVQSWWEKKKRSLKGACVCVYGGVGLQNDNCVKCSGDKHSHSLADTHNVAEFDVNEWKQSVFNFMLRNICHWQKN